MPAGDETLQTVKAYIAKYNLEEELSNAVNEAIKLDSDDPYKVISDYLKKFANKDDEDDYDEDDDEIIAEDDEPVMRAVGRRGQVAAKAFEVPKDWVAPVYEKTADEAAFLKEVMATNKLMKALSPSDREMLKDAFQKKDFASGEAIITQGDAGDIFYVLASGVCDITVTGKGSVMKATAGIAFGELALLHNAPRAATVTAEEPVTTWSLDEVSFKMILMGKAQSDQSMYLTLLKKVPILQHLSDAELNNLGGCLKEAEFASGSNIICEGDEGHTFYIIREGEVKCTKVGAAEEVSRRLVEGDFFGELALLRGDKRAATVSSVQPTKVLTINRAEFTRLLGKLEPPKYD